MMIDMIVPQKTQTSLAGRGIDQAAAALSWRAAREGWEYPVFDTAGRVIARRFKNANSSARPKYLWLNNTKALYYHAGKAFIPAIAAAAGALHLVNGEPAVLSMHAAGLFNTVCFFGETSAPPSLLDDLRAWGVTTLHYYPDNDATGRRAALKIRALLAESDIRFVCHELPSDLPEKSDLNDLWQALDFDATRFRRALEQLPTAILPETDTPRQTPAPEITTGGGDLPQKLIADIVSALHASRQPRQRAEWLGPVECPSGKHQHDHERPAAQWHTSKHFLHCFKCGETFNAHQTAEALGIDPTAYYEKRPRRQEPRAVEIKPLALDTFQAAQKVHLRYISEIDLTTFIGHVGIVIKSGLGTGKTELIKRLIDDYERGRKYAPRVLYVSRLAALVKSTARRLGLVAYDGFSPDMGVSIASAPQLAITVDSLHKVAGAVYDLVILDETTAIFQQLEADTMRAGENARAYRALKAIVHNCAADVGQIFALDAHMTDTVTQWLTAQIDDGNWPDTMRGELVLTIENTRQTKAGETLHLLASRTKAYEEIYRLIELNEGPVFIPTSSKRESELIFAALQDRYPGRAGRLINSDNSMSQDAQQLMTSINAELPSLAYLVASPSLSTGIDITCPVRAVVGIFYNQPLDPAQMMQSMGRCRNAQERAAWVQTHEGRAETDWLAIYERRVKNADKTAALADFAAHGLVAYDDHLRGLNRLSATNEAHSNKLRNDTVSTFAALAKAEGYNVVVVEGENRALLASLRDIRKRLNEQHKARVLAADAIDHDAYRLAQMTGAMTPEIRAGHERYVIEDTVGLSIDATLFDRLKTPNLRAIVRRAADLRDEWNNIQQLDRDEAERPLSKRGHHTAERQLLESITQRYFDCLPGELARVLVDMPAPELEERLDGIVATFGDAMARLLNWRPGRQNSNIAVLRYVLNRFGIHIVSQQRRVPGTEQRPMFYSVDQQQNAEIERLALARLAHLERKRAAGTLSKICQTKTVMTDFRQTTEQHTMTSTPPLKKARWIPPPPPEWLPELEF